MKIHVLVVTLLLAGCAPLPPTPQDIQAKKFEAVPDKAVIYIVRPFGDSSMSGPLTIDGLGMISTNPRSYFRYEVVPGLHRIHGFGAATAAVAIQAEPGRLYFVRHSVFGGLRYGVTNMALQLVNEAEGRRLVEAAL